MNNIVFHIGYHKTATSWLQRVYFASHPNVKVISNCTEPWNDPLLKELIGSTDRKFDVDKCRNVLDQQLKKYQCTNESDIALVSAERLSGHPFSGGYDSYRIAERIYSIAPEAKVFFLYRDQVVMLSSMYKQLVSEGYLGKFSEFLNQKHWRSVCFNMEFYEYDLLTDKYIQLFGEKNIGIFKYEKMRSDAEQFLQGLCLWLGVPYLPPDDSKSSVNLSMKDKVIPFARILNHFRRSEMNPAPLFVLPDNLRTLLIKMRKYVPGGKVLMTEEIAKEIERRYQKSNVRMSLYGKTKSIDNE